MIHFVLFWACIGAVYGAMKTFFLLAEANHIRHEGGLFWEVLHSQVVGTAKAHAFLSFFCVTVIAFFS